MLEITGSVDSVEDCTQICLDTEDNTAFPLKCWQNICLSEIWIPSNLLPSRTKTSDSLKTKRSAFRTLQKRDSSKCIESFSVYTDSDLRNDEEIFKSDSDSDLILNCDADLEIKTEIKQLSENISSAIFAVSSSSNETHDIVKRNADYSSSKNSSLNSSTSKTNCNSSSDVKNICINSQNVNTNASKSSYDNIIHLSENTNFGNMVENIDDNKISDNLMKKELPLMQSMLAFCDQVHDVKSHSLKDSDKNLHASNSENASEAFVPGIFNTHMQFSSGNLKPSLKDADLHSLNEFEKKTATHLKWNNKKERKMKKKASKYIPLDEFLDDQPYGEDDNYDDFYYHVLRQSKLSENLPLNSNTEFPDLVSEGPKFIKSTKSDFKEDSDIRLQSLVNIISEQPETAENNNFSKCDDTVPFTKEVTFGKFIIENIPLDVTEDDICTILVAYGEMKEFSLEVAGNFLKARVQMDLNYDIDWIIECLNGSEPFGASSETLKCYKED